MPEGQRRTKYYISRLFDKFSADGLQDKIVNGRAQDPIWPSTESKKELRARVRKVLDAIFVDENQDKKCTILLLSTLHLDLTMAHDSRLHHNPRRIHGSFFACRWTRAI